MKGLIEAWFCHPPPCVYQKLDSEPHVAAEHVFANKSGSHRATSFRKTVRSHGGPERSRTSDLRFRKPPDCQQDICGRILKCKNCCQSKDLDVSNRRRRCGY